MKQMDLVYVTYNSSRWIDHCFASIMKSDYDLKKVNVFVVDNASQDDTLEKLNAVKEQYGQTVNAFEIISAGKNLGFGRANNLGFQHGNSEIVCFLNIDTELCADTLKQLDADISQSEDTFSLWELRQFPYEHPKFYDAVTCETSWSSGAAFAIKRDVYAQVGGFDDGIFMYAEDVDLSWRLRSFGHRLRYVPKAVIYHYSYETSGQIKPNQYLNSVINNLLLRYRFGSLRDIIVGHARVLNQFRFPDVFPGSRKYLFKKYLKHFLNIFHFWNKKSRGNSKNFKPTFLGFDYAPIRDGAFYENEFPAENPLVSIIVRTCGRPAVLRETLISLRHQTYKNLEVVVVEDGEATAEEMIRKEFSDLNIQYKASGTKVGRSRAGNMAMELAKGKYLNFLDDDDLFYADHVEVLVKTIQRQNARVAYAFAFETPVVVHSKDPYHYTVHDYLGIHKQMYNKVILCHHNYIPIQCVMFEKSLFEQYGGLDVTLDALEDWDLWVRYSQYTDFVSVGKTTSIYRVPYDRTIDAKRQKELDDALITVREKHKGYAQTISVYDVAMLYQNGM